MSVGGWREPHSDSDSSADGEDEEDGKLKELVSNLCFLLGGMGGGGELCAWRREVLKEEVLDDLP